MFISCFCCRIPIHRVVLAGSSDYFKTAFSTHWTTEVTDNTALNEITFTVQEDEIIAFKAILKFFYTSILPEDLIICDLLIMFRLCDVLICNHLIQKIETKLLIASSDDIENNDLVCFFNLNVSIIDCTELNKKFQEVLVSRMANLHNMIVFDSEDQDDLFFKLPLRGIVALFSYDKLWITHENEVLRLLIAWVTKTKHDSEDLSVLRDCVRVCHLDMTLINEVLQKQEWFEFSDNEKEIACAYCIYARNVQIVPKPDDIPVIWFQKREYRMIEPSSSFFIPVVIISNNENSAISDISYFHGFDIMCDVEVTVSNTIKGDVLVTFPERHDEVVPVFVLVIYNVSINGVEYGPFQQLTRDTPTSIIWREEPLSEEERNGVRIQVRVIEFHC